ncbi:hypothetical protein B7494_g4814 [Chlorociboria aeruginascens]|nr:hypothetical protein B7494_g4814 [Chlorociboria aeruginascens]
MGRTSKFSFPIPGRKHPSNDGKDKRQTASNPTGQSKAQRLLGTDNDLNIDYPLRNGNEDHQWRKPGSRSSGMSISISESTHSIRSATGSRSDQWDVESGVFPRAGLQPSSTLLGQSYDSITDASSISQWIRNKGSSSTLKSYYDSQNSPLSISQQTSASSSRDLALRKGYPPLISRSPLLNVESSFDSLQQNFANAGHDGVGDTSQDKAARKKPTRLNLSTLFPRSRKNNDVVITESPGLSPSSTIRDSTRRKLRQPHSKESLQSQSQSIRSSSSPRLGGTTDPIADLYDHYEHLPARAQYMSQIPESRVTTQEADQTRKYRPLNNSPKPSPDKANQEPFSWKHVRTGPRSRPWETSSVNSASTRNTKTSRQTSTSNFSNSNLQKNSVLSLSSDSEEESPVSDPRKHKENSLSPNLPSRIYNGPSRKNADSPPDSLHQSLRIPPKQTPRNRPRKSSSQSNSVFTIPEITTLNTHLSGPWASDKSPQSSVGPGKRPSRKNSIASPRSSQQPTPPQSPASMEPEEGVERGSRLMSVTKQEEALLEALRQKRTRMREKILEEHQRDETRTTKSPPHIPNPDSAKLSGTSAKKEKAHHGSSKLSETLARKEKAHILLYLEPSEPSPDLSDFLTYGSDDEESTPRSSWVPPPRKSSARPDPVATPAKAKPQSTVRLSAVGVPGGFRTTERSSDQTIGSKNRHIQNAVRLVHEGKGAIHPQDFLLEENDHEGIWGM